MSKSQELLDPSDFGSAPPRKESKKKAKQAPVSSRPCIPVSGIYGVLLFFVSISILYANYMTFFGMDFSWTNVALLFPSTAFVALLVLYKFIK